MRTENLACGTALRSAGAHAAKRHYTIRDQVGEINASRGHYAYYGVAGNLRCLVKVSRAVERYWHRMLPAAVGPDDASTGTCSTRSKNGHCY